MFIPLIKQRKEIHMKDLDFPAPYIPEKLPLTKVITHLLSSPDFIQTAINSHATISQFVGYLQNIPNPNILISALTVQEAVLSSRIEGTIATIADILNDNKSTETLRNDIKEINNYREAIQYAFQEFQLRDNLTISKFLIITLHQILLSDNVRGANKTPGQFKTEQNFIHNTVLGNFTPLPPYLTNDYMENLVSYIQNANEVTPLIAIAIIHAQFEMIHPFKDGNGRVGRLLIPLYLFLKEIIPYPVFYISRFFADNDSDYKRYLHNLSSTTINSPEYFRAWQERIEFFLLGVREESQKHTNSASKISDLYKEMIGKVKKTEYIQVINFLFSNLRVTPTEVIEETKLNRKTVYNILSSLTEQGYLTKDGTPRKSIFIFKKITQILE